MERRIHSTTIANYRTSIKLVVITRKNICEDYTSLTGCVDKHTDSLPYALDFDDGHQSGIPSAAGCPRVASHRRRGVAQLPALSLTTVDNPTFRSPRTLCCMLQMLPTNHDAPCTPRPTQDLALVSSQGTNPQVFLRWSMVLPQRRRWGGMVCHHV